MMEDTPANYNEQNQRFPDQAEDHDQEQEMDGDNMEDEEEDEDDDEYGS